MEILDNCLELLYQPKEEDQQMDNLMELKSQKLFTK